MKNILKGLGFFTLVLLAGCKHDETISEPTLLNSFGEFSYKDTLSVSKSQIGFASDSVVSFHARFSIQTAWKLTIQGVKSGYVATITGNSIELDQKTATWDGRADVPVFPVDSAIATLSFPGHPERESKSVKLKVVSSKNIKKNPNYVVVKDFALGKTGIAFNADPGDIDFSGIDTIGGAICFSAIGAERGSSGYYMGGLAISASASNAGAKYFPILAAGEVADSDYVANTYFNIWVYGYGNQATKMTVQFKESDLGGASEGYQDPEDDAWEHAIYPTWEGWQQVSFPMNKTVASVAKPYGGSGNKRREIDRIAVVGINIGTEGGAEGAAETTYAYPVFSKNGPFNY